MTVAVHVVDLVLSTQAETGVDLKKRYNSISDKLNEKRRIGYVSVIIFPDMIYNSGTGRKM